ncbi:hypothetical protein [Leclercia sp.]|uniref:hypothetical protein n=1 Tax=Leclercia sp. TaxID=1898428 RepID=UPI0028AFE40E|nr:hypothetical protein [Leclercia sp.]
MAYPNRRGGGTGIPGTPGADGKQIQLQKADGYIQWRYAGDTSWMNLLPLSQISGVDGKNIDLQVADGWVQWRRQGDSAWNNLVSLSSMKGDPGAPNVLSIGAVSALPPGSPPSVSITGTSPSQVLNMAMPLPRDGQPGPANALSVGSVEVLPAGSAPQVTINGDAPSQSINFKLPAPRDGVDGSNGTNGLPGPANSLSVGSVQSLSPGSAPSVAITGQSPNQVISFSFPSPRDGINGTNGANGQANTLTVGTVQALPAGSSPTVQITGQSPNQTISFGIPLPVNGVNGSNGTNGVNNTITIGTVTALAPGSTPTATMSGTSPNQVLNLGLPLPVNGTNGTNGTNGAAGPANVLSIGTVASGATAAATITGTSPSQILNLTIPAGANGANGSNGISYTPQVPVSRTITPATAYQHTETTKPYKVIVNARATSNVTLLALGQVDRVELKIGPTAASVVLGAAGGYIMGVWETGITGISVTVGTSLQDGGQISADVPSGWYFSVNRQAGTTASIVSCFTQSLTP